MKKDDKTPEEAGMKLLRVPVKPKVIPNFSVGARNKKYISWQNFVSHLYWNVELQGD